MRWNRLLMLVSSGATALSVHGLAQMTPEATRGTLIRHVNPDCKRGTTCYGIKGIVKVNIDIGSDGKVKAAKPISGDPRLIGPVVAAVKKWEYTPYTVNGKPIEAVKTIDVNVE